MKSFQPAPPPPVAVVPESLPEFALAYEKVEATSSNIFRYFMKISDNLLSISIDDLQNNRAGKGVCDKFRRESSCLPKRPRDSFR